jgi:hypothetical protein
MTVDFRIIKLGIVDSVSHLEESATRRDIAATTAHRMQERLVVGEELWIFSLHSDFC